MDYGLISCQMVGKLRQPVDIELFKKLATVYGSTTQLAIFRASHALYL